jgi:hypothetical protein
MNLKIAPKPVTTAGTQPTQNVAADRQKLTKAANDAVATAIAQQNPQHPLLQKFGKDLGVTLGVIVTEALAAKPSWNAPLKDGNGRPVQSIPGATRQGDYDIRKRHEEVIGPKINAKVQNMKPGAIHDLVQGLGQGATEAPGDSYRLEAKIHGWIRPR